MNTSLVKARAWFLTLAASLLLAGGCNKTPEAPKSPDASPPPAPGEVSGPVNLDGKPLPGGWIAFHGTDPADVVIATVADGKYKAPRVPVGEGVKVTIDVDRVAAEENALNQRMQEATVRAGLLGETGEPESVAKKSFDDLKARQDQLTRLRKTLAGIKINPKYAQVETTPLSVSVKSGPQTIAIELTR